jgi:pilus assembly protein CpaB
VRNRFIGLTLSIVLAAAGTIVLVGYVQSAHDKAGAAEPVVEVLVVTAEIPRGTKASELDGKVEVVEVPEDMKLAGAVSSTTGLAGKVAATTLLPGEQVLAARFQAPEVLGREGVPEGLLEVTVQLSAARALGGELRPGDTVAVISSFEPFEVELSGLPGGADAPKTPNTSHVILHKVLVTNVQSADAVKDRGEDDEDDAAEGDERTIEQVPTSELFVTLALNATDVQRVVFTAEFGTLWLSAEPTDAPDEDTRIETRGTVYE